LLTRTAQNRLHRFATSYRAVTVRGRSAEPLFQHPEFLPVGLPREIIKGHMSETETAIETVKFYVNGKWEVPAGHELHSITNPATGRVIARTAYASAADIDRVARAAHEAFLKWREVPVVDRVQILYRYKD